MVFTCQSIFINTDKQCIKPSEHRTSLRYEQYNHNIKINKSFHSGIRHRDTEPVISARQSKAYHFER